MDFKYLCDKYQLNDTETSILKYLQENISDLKKIGIRKVAKDNYTSTTTVYKLCKKLNFEGYSDMIYHFTYSSQIDDSETNIDIYTNTNKQIDNNLEAFNNILKKYENKLIMFVSTGISQTIANYMNERLSVNGYRSIANAHIQLLSKENKDEVALLWRPHPLIKATVESMRPQLWEEYDRIVKKYQEEGWGIYDDTADVDRAIVLSDAYYGDGSSVVQMYKETGKPIMMQNVEIVE